MSFNAGDYILKRETTTCKFILVNILNITKVMSERMEC